MKKAGGPDGWTESCEDADGGTQQDDTQQDADGGTQHDDTQQDARGVTQDDDGGTGGMHGDPKKHTDQTPFTSGGIRLDV